MREIRAIEGESSAGTTSYADDADERNRYEANPEKDETAPLTEGCRIVGEATFGRRPDDRDARREALPVSCHDTERIRVGGLTMPPMNPCHKVLPRSVPACPPETWRKGQRRREREETERTIRLWTPRVEVKA